MRFRKAKFSKESTQQIKLANCICITKGKDWSPLNFLSFEDSPRSTQNSRRRR